MTLQGAEWEVIQGFNCHSSSRDVQKVTRDPRATSAYVMLRVEGLQGLTATCRRLIVQTGGCKLFQTKNTKKTRF